MISVLSVIPWLFRNLLKCRFSTGCSFEAPREVDRIWEPSSSLIPGEEPIAERHLTRRDNPTPVSFSDTAPGVKTPEQLYERFLPVLSGRDHATGGGAYSFPKLRSKNAMKHRLRYGNFLAGSSIFLGQNQLKYTIGIFRMNFAFIHFVSQTKTA